MRAKRISLKQILGIFLFLATLCTLLQNNNYTHATVHQIPITVTATNASKIYGDDDPQSFEYTAVNNGSPVDDLSGITVSRKEGENVGAYEITVSRLGGDDSKYKYDITFIPGTFTIEPRPITVDVIVADKPYDGTNTATITSATLNGVLAKDQEKVGVNYNAATFESADVGENILVNCTFELTGEESVLKNYTFTPPTDLRANITNNWEPTEFTITDPNENGWYRKDIVITPMENYQLTLDTGNDSYNWKELLVLSEEGESKEITFRVKNKDNKAISNPKTITYNLDKKPPTGTIYFEETDNWQKIINYLTLDLFYKNKVTVKIDTEDNISGVKSIEYYASDKEMTLEELEQIENWMPYEGGIEVALKDSKKFIYFARITDNAGNVKYLSTDLAEYDTTAPVISGVENGKTYYTTKKVTVTDKNLGNIVLNGKEVSDVILLDGNKDAIYTIVASDKAKNSTNVTITMKPIATIRKPIEYITEENVTPYDKSTIQVILSEVTELLNEEYVTDEEQMILEEIKREAEKLLNKIKEFEKPTDTDDKEKEDEPEKTEEEEEVKIEKVENEKEIVEFPEDIIISDNEEPASTTEEPKENDGEPTSVDTVPTGDNNNISLWLTMLFISGISTILVSLYERKKKVATKK